MKESTEEYLKGGATFGWALIKRLVLGRSYTSSMFSAQSASKHFQKAKELRALEQQRDAVSQTTKQTGYRITANCTRCGACVDFCPVGAITELDDHSYAILTSACIECGGCESACPSDAIVSRS